MAHQGRDRPSANRSIPNWDLSLVLLALTRPPFEPLAKADLKILTFKTVFLLALASGKRRSEIHAWTFDSFSRKRDWSEVTFLPSTAFIAKNQLASGPLAIQPVVIPALKPTLDPSLVQDKSLCPVRSLRYYLDKTKDLRKGKNLLFVAIKEGYSKDISKATISSWIKQSIILAYQKSDQEVQMFPKSRHMRLELWLPLWLLRELLWMRLWLPVSGEAILLSQIFTSKICAGIMVML